MLDDLPDTILPIYPGLGTAIRNALAWASPVAEERVHAQDPVFKIQNNMKKAKITEFKYPFGIGGRSI